MKGLRWLAAGLMVVVILLACFFILLRTPEVYRWLMKVNQVYQTVDLPAETIDQSAQVISDYMIGSSPYLLLNHDGTSLFKAQEVFHMYEVRLIFQAMKQLLIFCSLMLAGLIILLRHDRFIILKKQLYLMLGLFGLIGVASLFFDQAFLWMHQTLFNNMFWQFRYDHPLIQLLPVGFFLGFLILTGVAALLLSLGLYFMGRQPEPFETSGGV